MGNSAAPSPSWPAMTMADADALLTRAGGPFEMETQVIRGLAVRTWKNAPPTLRHLFQAGRAHGARTFLVHEDERVDYEAFGRAAIAFAHRLQADGIKPGDRVAVIMRNMPEWPVAFFGASLVGAIVAPLNGWWSAKELEFGLADCGASAAVFDGDRFERFAARAHDCPNLKRLYLARHAGAPGCVRMEDVLGPPRRWADLPAVEPPEVALSADDDAVIFYTSGTSGRPKGALATHRNVTCNVMASAGAVVRAQLRRGEVPAAADPAGPQKAYLCGIPFFHVTGFCAMLQVAIFAGYKVVLMRRWDAGAALALIERERITNAGGVPTLAWQLVQHPQRAEYDLTSLEVVSYGGAPAAPELVRQLGEAFPRAAPGIGWGMTETSATFTLNLAEDYQSRPDSAGTALPVGDMRVIGPDGAVLPTGAVGELCVRGPNVVKGYWNNPEATAEAIVDGWLHTGDLARLDEEGFVYIVDRAKDMIIRGGENIYCIEVENALFEHPAVADVALQAMPHQTLGEEPGAVVVLNPGETATADELRAFVAERLAAFKAPVKVVFSAQPLPRNANGKVLKSEIKRMLVEG